MKIKSSVTIACFLPGPAEELSAPRYLAKLVLINMPNKITGGKSLHF